MMTNVDGGADGGVDGGAVAHCHCRVRTPVSGFSVPPVTRRAGAPNGVAWTVPMGETVNVATNVAPSKTWPDGTGWVVGAGLPAWRVGPSSTGPCLSVYAVDDDAVVVPAITSFRAAARAIVPA